VRRDLFTDDHEAFRQLARDFVEKEGEPHYDEWEKAGRMPRKVFEKLGSLGILGMAIPEDYGGSGLPDYRYNVALHEEAARALVTLGTVCTRLEVILPYFLHLRQRRAMAALVSRPGRGHAAHRDRDDRTGHRLRSRGNSHRGRT
jgi:acyl-CoA dehydrogenase